MEAQMENKTQVVNTTHGNQLEGVYRTRRPVWCRTQSGLPFIRMTLEDQNGAFPAYIWKPGEMELPDELACVQVRGQIRFRSDGVVADLEHLETGVRRPEDIVRLIPRSLCPIPWLMPILESLLGQMENVALRKFLSDVLVDDSIAFPFVSCPASLSYHHNYPGGLLRHSVECTQILERYQEFAPDKKELGMVATLLHDIGKILTMTPQMRLTSLGRTLDHDKLTLEILAPHLRRLDNNWLEGAAELRYLLTWRPGRRDPGMPKTPLANAVLGADRVSAGLDAR